MKRRDLLVMFGSAAIQWPLAVRAQPAAKPTIGFLGPSSAAADRTRRAAFLQRLGELGWVEDHNITIDNRWAEGSVARAGEIAVEFARLKVDIIVASGDAQVLAARKATAVIPFVAPDVLFVSEACEHERIPRRHVGRGAACWNRARRRAGRSGVRPPVSTSVVRTRHPHPWRPPAR